MKKSVLLIIVGFFFAGLAGAQGVPPTQTINTNPGIACNAIGSQGAVTFCQPGWSYGCNSSVTSLQILATDGNRTAILIQDTGATPIVMTFGDTATPVNGFVIQPGNSFLWSNMSQANIPGRINTTAISIISNGPSTCTFSFSE